MRFDHDIFEKEEREKKVRSSNSDINGFLEPPFLSQVGLLLTYYCPISCQHCMVNAGPCRSEEMGIKEAENWIYQIAKYKDGYVKSIGFTGGEPFSCLEKLIKLSNHANQLGLTYTISTNGFWADTKKKALEILNQLNPTDISVSTDIYHIKHIPIERIKYVYEGCLEKCISCDITMAYEPKIYKETKGLISQILKFASKDSIRITRVFPSGRGEKQADFCDGSTIIKPPSKTPCLFSTVPYILPNGDVIACIGPNINLPRENNPLFMGSIAVNSVNEIFEKSKKNSILHGYRIWGPKFWHKLIEAYGPKELLPKGYHSDSPCECCITLLKEPLVRSFFYHISKSKDLKEYVRKAGEKILNEIY